MSKQQRRLAELKRREVEKPAMVLKEFAPGRIIKLHGGYDPEGMLGLVLPDAVISPDPGRMVAKVIVSTSSPDRSGDVVEPMGYDLVDHKANPVVLFCHKQDLPIGFAEDRDTGAYTAKSAGDRVIAETFFNQRTKLGHQVFDGVYRKMFRGVSPGFKPINGHIGKTAFGGVHYRRVKLIEYSHLLIPDNQEALVEAVYKGLNNEPLCDPLMQLLKPLCPDRNAAVTGGWESKPMADVTKAYPDDTLQGAAAADPMAPPAGGTDPSADPAIADQDSAASPDAQHEEAIHDGTEQHIAALWNKYRGQGLSVADTLDKMKVALEANEKLVGRGDDDDQLPDLDEDDEDDEDDDEGMDDFEPDLNDDDKERAQKMCSLVWTKGYANTMSRVADDLAHVIAHDNLDPRKAQAFLRKTLDRMTALPEFDAVVQKALKAAVVHDDPDDFDAGAVLPLITELTNRIETITG